MCAAAVRYAVTALLLWTPSAAAADLLPGPWRPVGPAINGTPVGLPSGLAGRVSAVAALPGRPTTELVGTLGGIWRKAGTGRWTDVTNAGWPSTSIGSLVVDPSNPRVVYAGTGYDVIDDYGAQPGAGVLKSTDGGTTWTPLVRSEGLMRGYGVTGLAVDPKDDQVVLAATNAGLFRSADGGRTWNAVLRARPASAGIAEVRIAVDPISGEFLAGVAQSVGISARVGARTLTTGHAVYRSTDAGRSWQPSTVDARGGPGLVVVPGIASARGHTYAYALDITGDAGSGVYASADRGRSWHLETTQAITIKDSIGQLVVDPKNPTHAYFAQADGPFVYVWGRHGAATLSGVDGSFPQFGDWRALVIGPGPAGTRALYGGTDGGTCFYDFATKTFTNNDDGGLVSGLDYFGSARSSTLEVSGAQDLGIDLYQGGSASQELENVDAYGVLSDVSHPGTYYASVYPPGNSPATFVVSHNSGATWSTVRLPTAAGDVFSLSPVQAAGDPSVLILPEQNGTLYVSRDDGRHWAVRAIRGLDGDYVTAVGATLIRGAAVPVMYVGTGLGGLWRSGDLGATWAHVNIPNRMGLSVNDIVIDPSTSSGAGGEHVSIALGVFGPQAYANQRVVGGVLQTSDSGVSWSDLSGSLTTTSVNTLALNGSTLLAGTDNGVVEYSGGTWSTAGTGFPNVRVNKLFVSADGSAIFATTYGRGTLESILVPGSTGGFGPSAPRNVVPPSISGTPVVGRSLTSDTGTWTGFPRSRFRRQWQRCRGRCENIPGAGGRSYTLTGADAGAAVRVVIRATNRLGSRTVASRPVPVHTAHLAIGHV